VYLEDQGLAVLRFGFAQLILGEQCITEAHRAAVTRIMNENVVLSTMLGQTEENLALFGWMLRAV
jgi:hypothetical protein